MKLQGKLLAVIVVAIVCAMLALASMAYAQLRQQSESDLFRQMQLLLEQTHQKTLTSLRTASANTLLFARSNLMERYVLIEDEVERYDLMQPALLRLFANYQQAYPEYKELRMILPDGYEDTRLAQAGLANLTEEEFDTPYFQDMRTHVNEQFSTILTYPDDQTTSLITSTTIRRRNAADGSFRSAGELRGFMTLTIDLPELGQQVINARIGQTGYLMALYRNGDVAFQSMQEDMDTPAPNHARLINLFPQDGSNDGVISTSLNSEAVSIQGQWLHPDLLLIAVLPDKEFSAISIRLISSVASVVTIAILVTSLILFLLLRSLVVEPVRQLRSTAIAIGDGRSAELPKRNLLRADEIGDLTKAFRDMQQKLGTSMDALKQSHAKIEQLAYRDSLTGLANRRLFLDQLGAAIYQAASSHKQLAVLFLDLDDFKRINDTLGHEAGDELLQAVSDRLSGCIRDLDHVFSSKCTASNELPAGSVARLGGDEFIILIHNLDDVSAVRRIAERVLRTLKDPLAIQNHRFVVGTSIGIATYPEHGDDVEQLIKHADMAMYDAKHTQKNSYRIYGNNLQSDIESRIGLEHDLRDSFENGDLHLNFQAQYASQTRSMIGAEVLLRWSHPERGFVSPVDFIPIAEETGLIGPIGEWIFMETCRQWTEWQNMGIAPPRLSVNVSQRQFTLSNVLDTVANALAIHNMLPEALEVEITESCIMEAPSNVIATLESLRDRGVRIAMDDFGTGYSSLGALTTLPIDTLKIDRSFITGVEVGNANEKIVAAILSLAQGLNLEVIAEGVETQSELDYLREKNCDIVQGYLFSRPLNTADMTILLEEEYGSSDDPGIDLLRVVG
ncbi:MAG: EAL domain-containing protein [Granulosicoccus sp.]|nr:EAL domain-containing protein [Granulosicoccus sp.]